MDKTNMKGVVCLSGGLDSCALAAEAIEKGYELHALTFKYGQLHEKEIECARMIAFELDIPWRVGDLKFIKQLFSSSGSTLLVGGVEDHKEIGNNEIISSYVPMRNTIFLSIAAGYAESIGADNLFIGACFVDSGHYPDTTSAYLEEMKVALMKGSGRWSSGERRLEIHHHGNRSKADIVKVGMKCGAPFELSWSCYNPTKEGRPCLRCNSCHNRIKGFREVGIKDPILTDGEWDEAILKLL